MPVLTLEYTRSIKASPTQVWGVIVDFDDYPEWNPFVTRCASELTPGAPIVMSVNMGMFTTEQTEQVTRVEAESLFEYRMRPVGKRFTVNVSTGSRPPLRVAAVTPLTLNCEAGCHPWWGF